jgi:hypothetical protein
VSRLAHQVQPVQRRHIAARQHVRVVDLEAGGERVVEDQAGALRLRRGDIKDGDETLALADRGEIDGLPSRVK